MNDAAPLNPRITPLLRSVTALEVAVLAVAGLGLLLDVAAVTGVSELDHLRLLKSPAGSWRNSLFPAAGSNRGDETNHQTFSITLFRLQPP